MSTFVKKAAATFSVILSISVFSSIIIPKSTGAAHGPTKKKKVTFCRAGKIITYIDDLYWKSLQDNLSQKNMKLFVTNLENTLKIFKLIFSLKECFEYKLFRKQWKKWLLTDVTLSFQ